MHCTAEEVTWQAVEKNAIDDFPESNYVISCLVMYISFNIMSQLGFLQNWNFNHELVLFPEFSLMSSFALGRIEMYPRAPNLIYDCNLFLTWIIVHSRCTDKPKQNTTNILHSVPLSDHCTTVYPPAANI